MPRVRDRGWLARLIGVVALLLWVAPGTVRAAPSVAIVDVAIVDPPLARTQPAMTVLIDGERIVAVGPAATMLVPADARRIDGSGRFLMPGLWDMHVHVLRGVRPEVYFPLLIAMGVTGVRDMGGDDGFARLRQLRTEIAAGVRIGPRFIAPGPFVDGPYPSIPQWSRVVADPAGARALVAELKAGGADFIKVYNRLPRDAYFALAAMARQLQIPFAGHVPAAVSAREAAAAGQRSVEHLFNVAFACSTEEDALMRRKAEVLAGGEAESRRQNRRAYLREVLATYSAERCAALFADFARLGTWQVPTLVQRRAFAQPETIRLPAGQLAYVPQSQQVRWLPGQDARLQAREAEDREIERQFFARDRALIAGMRAAGVPLLAGTDGGDPYSVPGFSLHDELGELVAAGLTPAEALQAATSGAARFLGREHELGRIAPGYLADLLLLDADPLAAIGNTRRIDAVFAGGRHFSRRQLDELLREARAAAARS